MSRENEQPPVCVEPFRAYRRIAVTDRRIKQEYAQIIKWLVDEVYPEDEVLRMVQDNLKWSAIMWAAVTNPSTGTQPSTSTRRSTRS